MAKVILSLDGGGVGCAATTQFWMRLEDRLQRLGGLGMDQCVDLFACTSTGATIALALGTTDLPLLEPNKLYVQEHTQQIFAENWGWFVPMDKHALAAAYAVGPHKPAVLKSTERAYRGLLSWQVADSPSAAPTYFPTRPPALADDERWLMDGGVTANNPTLCALAEVRRG